MTEPAMVLEGFTDAEVIRFTDNVVVGDGCWEWMAAKTRGYGRFYMRGQMPGAHRVSYQMFVGPIPDGLTLDHLCRNPGCVRFDHLEPVSNRENVLRGEGTSARHARQTHCKRGHKFDAANTYVHRGKRYCRTCQRIRFGREPSDVNTDREGRR